MRLLLAALPVLAFAAGIAGWEEQAFRGKVPTSYAFIKEGEGSVIEATCRASASGLIRREKLDLARTPFLRWRWRIESIYRGIDERGKAGDDYPARVYVVLDGGLLAWRTRSLVYVWSTSSATSGSTSRRSTAWRS